MRDIKLERSKVIDNLENCVLSLLDTCESLESTHTKQQICDLLEDRNYIDSLGLDSDVIDKALHYVKDYYTNYFSKPNVMFKIQRRFFRYLKSVDLKATYFETKPTDYIHCGCFKRIMETYLEIVKEDGKKKKKDGTIYGSDLQAYEVTDKGPKSLATISYTDFDKLEKFIKIDAAMKFSKNMRNNLRLNLGRR